MSLQIRDSVNVSLKGLLRRERGGKGIIIPKSKHRRSGHTFFRKGIIIPKSAPSQCR